MSTLNKDSGATPQEPKDKLPAVAKFWSLSLPERKKILSRKARARSNVPSPVFSPSFLQPASSHGSLAVNVFSAPLRYACAPHRFTSFRFDTCAPLPCEHDAAERREIKKSSVTHPFAPGGLCPPPLGSPWPHSGRWVAYQHVIIKIIKNEILCVYANK